MVLVQQLATPFIRCRCQRPAFESEAHVRDFVGNERTREAG
jgi:hypothetical protein